MATSFPGGLGLEIPELACVELAATGSEICIFFPGGATFCASYGFELCDPAEVIKPLLAQVNTALAPLTPFLNVLDVLKALVDCVSAIPDSLGPPPDPTAISNCIPGLLEALEKLAELFPPLSLFKLVKSILLAIIAFLVGLRNKIAAFVDQLERIAAAATAAAALGNVRLQAVVDCATGNLDVQLQNLNASVAPLNRLIGLVNTILELAGLPCIPTLADLGDFLTDPLDTLIEILQTIADAIPTSLDLGAIPPPDEPC